MRSRVLLAAIVAFAPAIFAQQMVSQDERFHWRQVRMVMSDYPEATKIRDECAFVTNVENRLAGGNRNVAQKRMLRQAGNRGANVVIVHGDSGRDWVKALFTGYTVSGEAYRCG